MPVIATPTQPQFRRLFRSPDDKLVAGVAGGLADHLGVDALVVRGVFALLTALGGWGVLVYAAFWAVVPQQPADPAPGRRGERPARGPERAQLLAYGSLALGGLLAVRAIGLWFGDAVVWPLLLVGVGAAIIWRQADDVQRKRWAHLPERLSLTEDLRRVGILRVLVGALLVVAGVAGFLAAHNELQAARDGVAATVAVVLGLALIFAPWGLRLATDLTAERRERIRSQERAELAARIHDSVLQTLTLIQRHADAPAEVQRLARGQERELRSWLYGRPPAAEGEVLSTAVAAVAAEVEDRHGVRVEVVTVGDRPLDDQLRSLVLAAREALTNAAKFAGVPEVSLYVEVEGDRVSAFVRDRGVGFDLDEVAADRQGIAESIVGRMARVGGKAVVRSDPGEGTEVELVVPA